MRHPTFFLSLGGDNGRLYLTEREPYCFVAHTATASASVLKVTCCFTWPDGTFLVADRFSASLQLNATLWHLPRATANG